MEGNFFFMKNVVNCLSFKIVGDDACVLLHAEFWEIHLNELLNLN